MKACPQCGRIVESCFHYGICDGETIQAVEMDSSEIRELLRSTIESLESEIEGLRAQLEDVTL